MSKDKKLTINQVKGMVHSAYDQLEVLSLAASEQTLKELFGIGPERFARYKERYLEVFGEKAAEMSEGIIRQARKRC